MSLGLRVGRKSRPLFDSSKNHLLIDAKPANRHFDVIEIPVAPVTVGFAETSETVVFEFVHNLGYVPYIDSYFWSADSDALQSNPYYKNYYSFVDIGSSGGHDLLYLKIDSGKFQVIHSYFDATLSLGETSTDTPVDVKMKYTVFSNEGYIQA